MEGNCLEFQVSSVSAYLCGSLSSVLLIPDNLLVHYYSSGHLTICLVFVYNPWPTDTPDHLQDKLLIVVSAAQMRRLLFAASLVLIMSLRR